MIASQLVGALQLARALGDNAEGKALLAAARRDLLAHTTAARRRLSRAGARVSATAPGAARRRPGAVGATQQMLHAPVVATLFRLATPNVIGLFAMPLVIGYDGFILGRLGADALAGVALVFPLSMLMMQMSGGGMGGAVTAAVARALGGGRNDDASRLAQHARR